MKANCEAGETETNAHIGHAYLPTYVWRPTHPVASLFSASFSSIIIIYILFTVNAHRFLHPYAKETESNHFTMLHPFRMCMWLLLNCIVGGKSPSFPLLCRLPVVLATLTLFLAWIIFSALSLSHSFVSCSFHFHSLAAAWHLSMMNSYHTQNDFRRNARCVFEASPNQKDGNFQ